jgi:hypothetical protein
MILWKEIRPMQETDEVSNYYTYEEAAEVLDVSYPHLIRAINQFGVFHPVHIEKGARKHLLKSEVDAMVGEQLFTQRKIKKSKQVSLQDVPDARIDVEAIRAEVARQAISAVTDVLGSFLKPTTVENIKKELSREMVTT